MRRCTHGRRELGRARDGEALGRDAYTDGESKVEYLQKLHEAQFLKVSLASGQGCLRRGVIYNILLATEASECL